MSPQHPCEDGDPERIIDKVRATYDSMQTYKANGVGSVHLTENGRETRVQTSFSMVLKKPRQYLISWTQKNPMMPGMSAQSGAVWSDGTQPYLYMGTVNSYSEMEDDSMALAAATGISGGAAFTIPSLFLPAFDDQTAPFSELVDPKLERTEKVEGEDCYIISAPSAISRKETLWISVTGHLLVKSSRSLEPPEKGLATPEMTDEDLEEVLKAMGEEATKESKQKMRDMLDMSENLADTAKTKGSITELHTGISSPKLAASDFEFALPEGTELKDSLFGNMLRSGDRMGYT